MPLIAAADVDCGAAGDGIAFGLSGVCCVACGCIG